MRDPPTRETVAVRVAPAHGADAAATTAPISPARNTQVKRTIQTILIKPRATIKTATAAIAALRETRQLIQ